MRVQRQSRSFWVAVQNENTLLGFYKVDYPAPDSISVLKTGYVTDKSSLATTFPLVRYRRGNDAVEVVVDSHGFDLNFWLDVAGFVPAPAR